MGITPFSGPLLGMRDNPLGSVGTGSANQNSQQAPWMSLELLALHDGRVPFTYKNGGDPTTMKAYGFMMGGGLITLDQAPSAIAADNIAASASPGAGAITLVSVSGAGITAGVSITRADNGSTVTGLLAIDGAMAGVGFGQDQTINMWDPTKSVSRNVRITSGGDDSLLTFTVTGYDLYGYPMSEAITGANNGIASGKKAFKYISAVTHTGSVATTLSVGTGDVIGLPIRADRIPYLQVWWGNPQSETIAGGSVTASEQVIQIPVLDISLINSAVYKADIPFGFTLKSAQFRTGQIATGAGAAATLTATVNTLAVTGGVISLTLASQNASGNTVAASAISGANATGVAGTVEWTVSGVTAWTAGTGYIEMVVTNNDLQGGVFTAAVTTNPATTTTGDIRGTIALPSASDGTKRLTIFESVTVANISSITGLYGVAQNLATTNGS